MTDALQQLIKQFMPFAQERFGFEEPPKLFFKDDEVNAKDPLGKTAYYDPNERTITLYITGRHPKDILRSLGHELVHHKQNCCGMFDDAGPRKDGYAQSDPYLRQMEIEANRDGSMCLRDFEDMLKKENTTYYEHLQKGETSKMSTKKWKNKEISTLLSEAWGFKFNSLQEFDEFSGTGELQEEAEEVVQGEVEEEPSDESAEETEAPEGRDGAYDIADKIIDGIAGDGGNATTGGTDAAAGGIEEACEDEDEVIEEDSDTEVTEESVDADELKEAIKALLGLYLKG